MIPFDPLQGPAVVLGIAGAVLVAGREPGTRMVGFLAWVIGNLLWLIYGLGSADPYVSILFGVYWITAILGLKNSVMVRTGLQIDDAS